MIGTPGAIAPLPALRARADEHLEDPAILAPGLTPLTFSALLHHIESIAQALAGRGLGQNDVVAAVLPGDAETLCAFLAVSTVAGFAPLDSHLSDMEFESCLKDLCPAALLAAESVESGAITAAQKLGIAVLYVRALSQTGAGLFTILGLDALDTPITAVPDPSSVALLLRTSATTGRAKFVCLTHANLAVMASASRAALMLSRADRFLSVMPMFHLQGLLSAFVQLLAGGSVVCAAGFDVDRFGTLMNELQPTWYTAGPVLHRAILALPSEALAVAKWSRLRFVRSVGAALPPALLRQLQGTLGVPILEGYGLTEVGAVTSTPLGPNGSKPGSAGVRIVPGVEIMDDNGNLLPSGHTGQIVVRGPNVMREYRNEPEATRAAFRNGWFLTGDLGSFDADGYLFVTGRIKEMINRGGEKILPAEVDEVIAAHPSVAEAAAFGFPHPSLGEEVGVAIVQRPGASITASELRQFAAVSLTAFKIPRRVLFLDDIPKGPTGKPQRHKLAELACSDAFDASRPPFVPAASALEKALAGIWACVLNKEPIGLHDDFFDLGGDSFAITLMLSEVATIIGEIGDPAEFFLHPTVAILARLVATSNPDCELKPTSPIFALQPRGERVPFFCVPGATDDPYYLRYLAQRLGNEQPFYVLRDTRPGDKHTMNTVEETASRFVQALRKFRPQGPYALGGHCYGGVVAFEVARQMSADGDSIALLTLFDTPTPGYPKVMRQWKRWPKALMLFSQTPARSQLARGFLARRIQRVMAKAQARAHLTRQSSDVPAANALAMRIYVPRPFPGKALAFLATDELQTTRVLEDGRLGWRDFALGGFDVRHVSGGHDSMLTDPYVQEVAAQLTLLLEPLNSFRGPH